jgi:molecular chaperone GrpE
MRAVDPEGGPESDGPDASVEAPAKEVAVPEEAGAREAETATEPTPDQRIAALERDKKEALDRMLRIAADFDNYRKRARRETEDATRRAREEALCAVLAVADNLERALDHADEQNNASIAEGVRLVHRQLLAVLEKFDVRPYSSVGSAFNPEEHDAVGQQETAEAPPGSVTREMQRGYRVGNRVLRPAMVVVARPPAAAELTAANGGGEET